MYKCWSPDSPIVYEVIAPYGDVRRKKSLLKVELESLADSPAAQTIQNNKIIACNDSTSNLPFTISRPCEKFFEIWVARTKALSISSRVLEIHGKIWNII